MWCFRCSQPASLTCICCVSKSLHFVHWCLFTYVTSAVFCILSVTDATSFFADTVPVKDLLAEEILSTAEAKAVPCLRNLTDLDLSCAVKTRMLWVWQQSWAPGAKDTRSSFYFWYVMLGRLTELSLYIHPPWQISSVCVFLCSWCFC